jgi:hypothetical protein
MPTLAKSTFPLMEKKKFGGGRQGVAVANWIEAGSSYEFRLYNADHTAILEKVVVTKAT